MARTSTQVTIEQKAPEPVQLATYIPPDLKHEIALKAAEQKTRPSKLVAALLAREFPIRDSIKNPPGDTAEV
jgi:hypothetical protein